jgi:FKBP-type peptidyl-prolyl cis-trans isomerase
MRPRAVLSLAAALSSLLLAACGPSKEVVAAREAARKAAELAAFQARIKAMEEASRPPVLTARDAVVKGPEGLQYVDMKVGTGREAADGCTVDFIGWVDGVKIDSSSDRGKPFSFVLGSGTVIPGWNAGIRGMREGGTRLLIIPPGLAYGKQGKPGFVGPDKTLWYRIDLRKVYPPL